MTTPTTSSITQSLTAILQESPGVHAVVNGDEICVASSLTEESSVRGVAKIADLAQKVDQSVHLVFSSMEMPPKTAKLIQHGLLDLMVELNEQGRPWECSAVAFANLKRVLAAETHAPIRKLTFIDRGNEPETWERLAVALATSRGLEDFRAPGSYFGPKGTTALSKGLASAADLAYWRLDGKFRDPEAVNSLAEALQGKEQLRVLSLCGCDIGPDSLKKLAEPISQLGNLQKLFLGFKAGPFSSYNNHCEEEGAAAVTQMLRGNPGLKLVALDRVNLGEDEMANISEGLLALGSLQVWRANHNRIGDAGAIALGGKLGHCPDLKELHLSDNKIGNAGIAALASALKLHNPNLEELDLSLNRFSDEGAEALADLVRGHEKLTSLKLTSGTAATSALMGLVQGITQCPNLRELTLARTPIGDEGAIRLAAFLKTTEALEELRLTTASIGDEGVKALAEALKENKSLKRLYLRGNAFGETGTEALLGAIQVNGTLEYLDPIPDSSVECGLWRLGRTC